MKSSDLQVNKFNDKTNVSKGYFSVPEFTERYFFLQSNVCGSLNHDDFGKRI